MIDAEVERLAEIRQQVATLENEADAIVEAWKDASTTENGPWGERLISETYILSRAAPTYKNTTDPRFPDVALDMGLITAAEYSQINPLPEATPPVRAVSRRACVKLAKTSDRLQSLLDDYTTQWANLGKVRLVNEESGEIVLELKA